MKKMQINVAIDASIAQPPFSGVHRAVRQDVLAMAKTIPKGIKFCVFAPEDFPHMPEPSDSLEFYLVPKITRHPFFRILWQQFCLPTILKRKEISALYSPAYTCPKRAKMPILLNVHDIIALRHPGLCSINNRLHMRFLLPASIRRASKIVVSSGAVYQELKQDFPKSLSKTKIIPMGVDLQRFSENHKAERIEDIVGKMPYFCFIGNLEPKKGVDVLLDAWELLPKETRPLLLVLGRPGWKCDKLVKRLLAGQEQGVFWLSDASDLEVVVALQNCLALVIPSLVEGFGLPVLEAISAGAAFIHSDDPALCEVADGRGQVFARNNPAQLATIIQNFPNSEKTINTNNHCGVNSWQERAEKLWDYILSMLPKSE